MLKRIRDDLRQIIKLATIDEYERLTKLDNLYGDKSRISRRALTPSQNKRSKSLIKMRQWLGIAYKLSICACTKGDFLHYSDITGDRACVYEIVPVSGRYLIKKAWYSLRYYNISGNLHEDLRDQAYEYMKEDNGIIVLPETYYLEV